MPKIIIVISSAVRNEDKIIPHSLDVVGGILNNSNISLANVLKISSVETKITKFNIALKEQVNAHSLYDSTNIPLILLRIIQIITIKNQNKIGRYKIRKNNRIVRIKPISVVTMDIKAILE